MIYPGNPTNQLLPMGEGWTPVVVVSAMFIVVYGIFIALLTMDRFLLNGQKHTRNRRK